MLWEHDVVSSSLAIPTRIEFMHFNQVVIDSIAYALPEERWTSERIEQALAPVYQRLHLQPGRLELMTGIRERRHWSLEFLPSEAATKAGEALLKKTDCPRNQIDGLIYASVCRDRLEPATASYVHKNLGLSPHTHCFDLSNACLGVLNACVVGASMIETNIVRSVLIVSGENGRPLLDNTLKTLLNDPNLSRSSIKPYFANLTIGSGAVAILLRNRRDVSSPKPLLLGGIVRTDSQASNLCEGQAIPGGLAMKTDSTALLESGIQLSQAAWSIFQSEMDWDASTPQCIITHQVGLQHQKKIYEALSLPIDKDVSTFSFLGNTGSVALPISLGYAIETQRIHANDKVLLLGIGSGLNTLMLGILWQN